MKYKFIETNSKYTGEQLQSLYAYLNFEILGDSIISWTGPCDVSLDHMVDGEDLLVKAKIKSDKMLHFIIEKFDTSLESMVLVQRLFANIVISQIKANSKTEAANKLIRKGDDIYCGDKKLNVSIATISPSSALLHFGINISNEGTPVPTCSLEDFKIEANSFAQNIMKAIAEELASVKRATQKVKWVK